MKHLFTLVFATLAFGQTLLSQDISSSFPIEPITEDLDEALNQFLFGSGVTAGEASSTPLSHHAIGRFTGGAEYIGIDSGLVLCTDAFDGTFFFPDAFSEPDLMAVANSVPQLIGVSFGVWNIYDVADINFEFVALGDSLSFNFVFASTEYEWFINSSFNDAFAFFLAGPGISGTFGAPEAYPNGAINIAVVPGSNPPLPITVSSVNSNTNSEYFISNLVESLTPGPVQFVFNGFTQVITAHANGLTPGEVYHIRLAIGDGSDSSYPSAVFLEAGSFTFSITAPETGEGDFNGDGILDILDLMTLLAQYECSADCTADIDGDGAVGISDLLAWLSLFD